MLKVSRAIICYGLSYSILSAYMIFGPLWLSQAGVSTTLIGSSLLIVSLARLVTIPVVFGGALSRYDYPLVLAACCVGTAAMTIGFALTSSSFLAFVFFTIARTFFGPIIPLVDYATSRVLSQRFGSARSVGSLSFMIGALLFGFFLEQTEGSSLVIVFMTASLIFLSSISFGFYSVKADVDADAIEQSDLNNTSTLSSLVKHSLLVCLGVVHASNAAYFTISSIHWNDMGLGSLNISALWSLGVLFELVGFWYSNEILKRFSIRKVCYFLGGASVVRWGLFGSLDGYFALIIIQMLQFFSVGLCYSCAVSYMNGFNSSGVARRLMSVYQTWALGVVAGLYAATSGILYDSVGVSALIYSAFGVALVFIFDASTLTSRVKKGSDK